MPPDHHHFHRRESVVVQKIPMLNPRNLGILPYLKNGVFADVIKLGILIRRDQPGLSRWALNLIINVLIGDRRGKD